MQTFSDFDFVVANNKEQKKKFFLSFQSQFSLYIEPLVSYHVSYKVRDFVSNEPPSHPARFYQMNASEHFTNMENKK